MLIHLRTETCFVAASAILVLFACTASADKQASPTPPAPPSTPAKPSPPASKSAAQADASSPDARGRAVLKAQLAALANEDAFAATFAKQATVLTPIGSNEVHAPNAGVAAAVAFLNPHADVKSATFDRFAAGGNAQVAWFAAELQITVTSHEPGSPASTDKHTVRVIELLDGAQDWRVAVGAFTNVGAWVART